LIINKRNQQNILIRRKNILINQQRILNNEAGLLQRIPKVLHLYWDRSPMSKLQTLTPITFHNQNPDWNINIYVPRQKYDGNDRFIPNYTGVDYFKVLEKLTYIKIIEVNLDNFGIRQDLHNILRSDIFRYHLLYEIGGVWSDFDVIWLKPMEHINNIETVNTIDTIGITVSLYEDISGHHSIGVLLASQKHLFYKELVDLVTYIQKKPELQHKTIYNLKAQQFYHQSFGVVLWNKLYPTLYNILNKYKDCLGIKYKSFYPYSVFALDQLYSKNNISVLDKDTICVHWFNGHPLSKEYINKKNYNQECAMTYIINLVDPDFYDNLL
jgi:hypothetical protein